MNQIREEETLNSTKEIHHKYQKFWLLLSIAIILAIILLVPSIGVLIAFIFIIIILWIERKRIKIFTSIGFKKPESIDKTLLLCLIYGIVIELSFQMFLNPLFEISTGSRIDLSSFDNVKGNFATYIIMLIIGWVVGGFIEEITFRGYLITRLVRVLGKSSLVLFCILLITSVPFGLSHLYQGWSGVLSTGSIAMVFGYIFIKNNYNIWYTILTHGFVNMVGFTILYFDLGDYLRFLW